MGIIYVITLNMRHGGLMIYRAYATKELAEKDYERLRERLEEQYESVPDVYGICVREVKFVEEEGLK